MEKISLQHRLEYWGYLFLEKSICSIPDTALPRAAKLFSVLIFNVLKIRRRATLRNLAIAFPQKSRQWCEKTALKSSFHFILLILEFMKMRVWEPEHLRNKIVEADVNGLIESIKQGKGAVIISGHFGNWEVAMGYFFTLGVRSAVIQQQQKNRLVNSRMKTLREKWGMEIIYPKGAVRQSGQAVGENKIIALLGDQDAGKKGCFVHFFNRLSSTHPGAALIHLKSGAPLFFGSCVRLTNFRYQLKISRLPDYYSGREIEPEEVTAVTARHTTLLENAIKKHPEQYFWMHRRWKTTPVEN